MNNSNHDYAPNDSVVAMTGRSWRRGATLGLLLVVGVSGCAAPPAGDPDAVQEWLTDQNEREAPGALATLSGLASEHDPAGEGGIGVTFDQPARITELVFSCFGAEAMSAAVTISMEGPETLTHSINTDNLTCADGPHVLEQVRDDVTSILIDGSSVDHQGAWSTTVIGED